jgi:hypothetical protein
MIRPGEERKGAAMAWSWVRVSTRTSPKLRDCMGGDLSAQKFVGCVQEIVEARGGGFDPRDVMFHPSGKWAKVRFEWDTPARKVGIVLDLEADEVEDYYEAGEIDDNR